MPTLEELLRDKRWYCRCRETLAEQLNLTSDELQEEIDSLNESFVGDYINCFTYEGIEYVGLESRRLDYQENALRALVKEIRSYDPDPARFDYQVLERAEGSLSK